MKSEISQIHLSEGEIVHIPSLTIKFTRQKNCQSLVNQGSGSFFETVVSAKQSWLIQTDFLYTSKVLKVSFQHLNFIIYSKQSHNSPLHLSGFYVSVYCISLSLFVVSRSPFLSSGIGESNFVIISP